MPCNTERRGYEFSDYTKAQAKIRARGRCQHPLGCSRRNDGTIDHLTGIRLGKLLGMDRDTIRSLDNAQMLCSEHQIEKLEQENKLHKMMQGHIHIPCNWRLQLVML